MKYVQKPKYPSKVDAVKLEQTVVITGPGLEDVCYKGQPGDYLVMAGGKLSVMKAEDFEKEYQLETVQTWRDILTIPAPALPAQPWGTNPSIPTQTWITCNNAPKP
jgi:hypothetical protein